MTTCVKIALSFYHFSKPHNEFVGGHNENMTATKQPKRAINGSPQFSLSDIFNACKLLDGRLIIPPDYAEIAIDELERLERVAESAVTLAGAVTGEIVIDSQHHAVREILALCGVGQAVAPGDDLPTTWKGQ